MKCHRLLNPVKGHFSLHLALFPFSFHGPLPRFIFIRGRIFHLSFWHVQDKKKPGEQVEDDEGVPFGGSGSEGDGENNMEMQNNECLITRGSRGSRAELLF